MCGTRRASQPPDRALEQAEAFAAFVALAEEELHADADSGHRPAGVDALAQRIVETVAGKAGGRALDVPDARDQRERRFEDDVGVGRDDRFDPRACERGRERAQVAGAVVGDRNPHAAPFVERMPSPPEATACRSAWPSAL